jgi:amino acid adenylation domain-containing protein
MRAHPDPPAVRPGSAPPAGGASAAGADDLPAGSGLTRSQFLLWMGQRLHPEAPLYNMALVFEIGGAVDAAHLDRAFAALLERSDALRTVIEEDGEEPRIRVREPFAHAVEQVDLSGSPDPDAALRRWAEARAARLFDLRERLFDTALLRLTPDRFAWYLNQHHLVTDGWSTALVYRYVAELYQLSLQGRLGEAPPLPPFSAYVEHERASRSSPRLVRAREHWRRALAEPLEPIRLYGKRPARETTRTERVTRDLGPDRSRRLRSLAAELGTGAITANLSLFHLFATALFAYLHRVSGQTRLRFGTPWHGRPTAAFRDTVGVFIEIFPFGAEVAEDDTFLSLFGRVQAEGGALLRHAQPGTSEPEVNRGGNVLLNFIHASFPPFAGLPVRSRWVHPGHGDSRHHLRLQVHDLDAAGSFLLHFDLNAALFDAVEREAAADHFLRVLDALLADPRRPIREVDLLAGERRPRVGGDPASPAGATVVEMFEARVARDPAAVAVVHGDRSLTYAELSRRAERLARRLRARGVGPESIVGLYLDRSLEAVEAILGVLRAGGAYLPLSPADPAERVADVLRDAGARVLLTVSGLAHRLAPHGAEVVRLDEEEALAPGAGEEPVHAPAPADAAYVLYTSGSTGRPKGVVVEHRSLAAYVGWARDFYLRGEPADFPLFTSLLFDLTVTSLFVPLVSGGRVVVYDERREGVPALLRVLEDDAVDVVKLTPSHLSLIRGLDLRASRVRVLILGGEDLGTGAARAARAAFGEVEIYNEYGPTEATVGCAIHRFDPRVDTDASVPIGRAVPHARLLLLDAGLNPLPPGVTGEIHVAGPALARGYLGRPALTAERFVPDPARPGERMYRTGDLGRWRPDGVLQYLGRADRQVKLRGVRVEPAEIETTMLDHPAIEACVVDVVGAAGHDAPGEVVLCARCGLASDYPGVSYDAEGVCHLCRAFERYRDKVQRYFRTMDDLRALLERARPRTRGRHDCLVLLSGGKDSTYALYRLAGMGLRILAFTLDNGYISPEAKANIRRVTDALGVEHVFGSTPAMNAIFVDSLQRHSAVCNGCFKTIYTLGTRLARERGIPVIVTGLSRGQFFETRLTEELFWNDSADLERIDRIILEARKTYHRTDDAVTRLLGAGEFRDDALFEEIEFVDFYRYCEVGLEEMLAFLAEHAPWIRPSDTGRSTNCLINEVGIAVHRRERGFHNYALPYSWDVRMGHKTRAAALEELDEEIDDGAVQDVLAEIGDEPGPGGEEASGDRLAAYYVARAPVAAAELRAHLGRRLPDSMIPSHFVRLDALPITPGGKLDRAALPRPRGWPPEPTAGHVPPRTPLEERIAAVWAEVLRTGPVGALDDFLELGGNSLLAIRIISRVNQVFGVDLPLRSAFEASSVAALARLVEQALLAEIGTLSEEEAERLRGSEPPSG